MAINVQFILDFLHTPGVEGKQELRGYVPCRQRNYYGDGDYHLLEPVASSGVTIGTGCDLGQWTKKRLSAAGVEDSIVLRLQSYIGRERYNALKALAQSPIMLSQDEGDRLDTSIISDYAKLVEQQYNKASPQSPFEELPDEAQACLFSLLYQRGCWSQKDYPRTWASMVRGDWNDVHSRMTNASLWKAYKNRRRIEGELLTSLLRR